MDGINDFSLVIWWPAASLMFPAHIVPLAYGSTQEASHLHVLAADLGPQKAVGRLSCYA